MTPQNPRHSTALRIATALTLIATLIAGIALASNSWNPKRNTFVAYFANTNGLYTGDEVRILSLIHI